ncbi:LolA family protein [Stackebrandtia soli]|uniref:LolA family protein n=1 Tax=Stackebrandtia soli TaxID=1892856 RepID=UPI0039E9C942
MRTSLKAVAGAGAVVVVVAGTAAGIVSARGEALPSPAQVLALLEGADVPGVSGTIVQNANLGLPGAFAARLDRSRSVRVWYAAPGRLRLAALDALGETDLIRNGGDLWVWDSDEDTATHYRLPYEAAALPLWPPSEVSGFVASPSEAARRALASVEPATTVAVERTVEVAGRAAHELVLTPRDAASLVDEVRLAVDAETGVPLRTRVYASGETEPVFEVAFSRVEFAEPDAENFTFVAPAGVTVRDGTAERAGEGRRARLLGSGWSSVLAVDVDPEWSSVLTGYLARSPQVSGSWGTGRLLTSSLFSVLVMDDGRLYVGAVTPERLYRAADEG